MRLNMGNLRRRAAMALAVVMGIGSWLTPLQTEAAVKDEIQVRDLLDESEFKPDRTNVKVSSEDPEYPGTDALMGDGIHYWKHSGKGVYKDVYEPSALFWAVDLGQEKTVESAYMVLANEAKYLNLTLDKVNAKNISNKFEIVYTSDDKIWEGLPEASDGVCEYQWDESGWELAGGTETEGLWSNASINGKDWACDTKTFHHPFTARYVMFYITLLGDANVVEENDLGLVDFKLFGYDKVENELKLDPERIDYFREIASDVSTAFPEGEKPVSVSHVTIGRALEVGSDEKPGDVERLRSGKDYEVLGDRIVLTREYLMTLPPADNQFIVRFQSGQESLFTVSVSSKSGTTAVINSVPGTSPFAVLGEGLGTDEPVEGATKRIRAALPQAESHIINLYDKELGRYVMSIQAHDSTCSIGCYAHKANYNKDTGELVDGDNSRQRIEIRPSTDSGMDLVAEEGDVTKYQWKWRLADDYPVSGSFNHIFQMKAVNGQRKGTLEGFTDPVQEHGKAIFSFTAVTKGLQFRNNDKVVVDQQGKEVSIPMDRVRGRWIDVSLEMLHADDGWVKVMITDSETGEVLMDYSGNHDTWRRPEQKDVGELDYPACFDQYNRPKWGIYRNGKRDTVNGLKASHIEFADLTLTKNGDDEEYITAISATEPNRLTFAVGEELDLTGMEVTATTSNAQRKTLEAGEYQVSGFDSHEPGERVLSVTVETTVGGKTYQLVERFPITITEDTYYVDGIRVSREPDKTVYYEGDELDPEGMEVKALHKASSSNASYEETVEDYDVDYDFSKAGKVPVTVSYAGENRQGEEQIFTATFDVTVKEESQRPVPVDKTELEKAVEECGKITNDNYTMESWNAFIRALGKAREVLENENATQEEVDKALEDLYKAVDGLTVKPDEPSQPDKPDEPDKPEEPDKPDEPNIRPSYSKGSRGSGSSNSKGPRYDSTKGMVDPVLGILTGEGSNYSNWVQDPESGSWKLRYANGTFAAGTYFTDADGTTKEQVAWEMVNGTWYAFGADGYAKDGFVQDYELGGMFYIDINQGMLTGWQMIEGKWHYFNTVSDGRKGIMAVSAATPDGYQVDADGVWIQ